MSESKATSLMGMKIFGQHGREIGVVADMTVGVESRQLQTLEVKLNRQTLDDSKLQRPWFGSQTVHVLVSEISGATDNLVLKSPLEEMEFSGGEPAAATLRFLVRLGAGTRCGGCVLTLIVLPWEMEFREPLGFSDFSAKDSQLARRI